MRQDKSFTGNPVTGPPRVLIVSGSFGAGHDRAAQQIAYRLAADGFEAPIVDLVDLVRSGAVMRRAYRLQIDRLPVTWDWLLAACSRPAGLRLARRSVLGAAGRLLDLVTPSTVAVISTYPLASQLLGQLRRSGDLRVPAVTFLTDMSVHPLWIATGIDRHFAIHRVAGQQAAGLGAEDVAVTGPLVDARFSPPTPAQRLAARRHFGLPLDERLALVVTGSWGVGQFARTADDIAATGLAVPVVACGQNGAARRRLQGAGHIALDWVDDMPRLLRAADVVVQSGGGMTSLEALATGVPVITYRSLAGHGRMSAEALHQAGWAPWARTVQELAVFLRHPAVPSPRPGNHDIVEQVRGLAGLSLSPA
ncbi:MGDG synthase family glycosyltransferase [Hamadaea tsunoensis]|uniref:MGDG synthase family glycosyltransferase n=1 Tax=Hamadaea tsunoensis TaxID=53368 RepID=UPI0004129D88|nr:glycosyltransferase [Hamadaea tsunoensis]